MSGRVLAVAICSFLISAAAFGQCNINQVASIGFRGTFLDVALDGNDLWAATSYGVSLYDRTTDPPALVASVAVPGTTRTLRAANSTAYVGSGSSIYIIRRNGKSLQIVRGVDAGAAVNDIIVTTLDLYVATSSGLTQWDLLDPTNPTKTPATLPTSGANVTSLALSGSTLYAADGDASVELFTITIPSIPQAIGVLHSALTRANAVSIAGGRVYVSDGNQTDVFVGNDASATRLATVAFGATSLVPLGANALFASGTDRRVRAFDVTTASSPIEIFRNELAPSFGTVNRISALAGDATRLYVAAGDIGLLTWDISAFISPFPLRSYSTGATTSVLSLGAKVYVSRAASGITEFSQSTSSGSVTQARSWDSNNDIVQDGSASDGFLLTSSGKSMTLWTLNSTTPVPVASATFSATVLSAIEIGTVGYAVLSDLTLWSADFGQLQPVPQPIALTATKPSLIARSGTSIAMAQLKDDGTTLLTFWSSPDFTKPPASASVNGIATGGLALSGSTAAIWTFLGVSVVDFAGGTTSVLPQSNSAVARGLAFAGTTLVEATSSALVVWNTTSRTLTKQFALPSAPVAVSVGSDNAIADVATADGIVTVQLNGTTRLPSLLSAGNANAYYRKVVAGGDRIDLFDGRGVDIFTSALHDVGSIRTSLIVDVAASDKGVFTISSNMSVASYSRDGVPLATAQISEGTDAQAKSIATANGAVWASIVRGCLSGGCEEKTIVFDARNGLSQTTTMTGAIRDVVTSGTRAYILTELPNEVRVLDVTDPTHPSQLVTRAAEGSQTPVAISYANGIVYVLGEKLYAYAEADLSKAGEQLASYPSDPTSAVTYVDQHVRIDGGCAAMTGRVFGPQLFTIASPSLWTGASTIVTPSPARSIASQPGTFYFLTDHSLEIWSTKALTPPTPRHRAAR